MDSGFTLTIDWLAFTVLASNPQETMRVLGGDWSKAKGGFRGYPLSWMRSDGLRGVGKLGTNAPRRPNEIHVDLSGGDQPPASAEAKSKTQLAKGHLQARPQVPGAKRRNSTEDAPG